MTSKYDPLGAYLTAQVTSEVPMSFADIEKVIGGALPPKAVNHPAWWSNNTSNNTMTRVWLDAGFRTERVDVARRKLVFRRVAGAGRAAQGPARQSDRPTAGRPRVGGLIARLRAALAGTARVMPGVDLAEPTGAAWDAEES